MYDEASECCSNLGWRPQQLLTVNTGRRGLPGGMCALGDTGHMCMCRRPSEWGRGEQEAGRWIPCSYTSPAESRLRETHLQIHTQGALHSRGPRQPSGAQGCVCWGCALGVSRGPRGLQAAGCLTAQVSLGSGAPVSSARLSPRWSTGSGSSSNGNNMRTRSLGFTKLSPLTSFHAFKIKRGRSSSVWVFVVPFHSCTHVLGRLWPLINVTQVCA